MTLAFLAAVTLWFLGLCAMALLAPKRKPLTLDDYYRTADSLHDRRVKDQERAYWARVQRGN